MKYVVGLPYRVKSFRDSLMATCKLENVFEIDNTENTNSEEIQEFIKFLQELDAHIKSDKILTSITKPVS